MKKLFLLFLVLCLLLSMTACSNDGSDNPPYIPKIGDSYGGGIVFYLDGSGGGLIAAASDQGTGVLWDANRRDITGATGTAIGTGKQNTTAIVTTVGDNGGIAYAAGVCNEYSVTVNGVTYDDWFLPSYNELEEMYKMRTTIGNFNTGNALYWSSSQIDKNVASGISFNSGLGWNMQKTDTSTSGQSFMVRAVRAF